MDRSFIVDEDLERERNPTKSCRKTGYGDHSEVIETGEKKIESEQKRNSGRFHNVAVRGFGSNGDSRRR